MNICGQELLCLKYVDSLSKPCIPCQKGCSVNGLFGCHDYGMHVFINVLPALPQQSFRRGSCHVQYRIFNEKVSTSAG